MSEPDRFEAKARDLLDERKNRGSEVMLIARVAAALRAAESSALERAAQHFKDRKCGKFGLIDRSDVVTELHRLASGLDPNTRAPIPPAAETAACTEMLLDHRCDEEGPHEQHRAENAGEGGADLVWTAAAPAAEAPDLREALEDLFGAVQNPDLYIEGVSTVTRPLRMAIAKARIALAARAALQGEIGKEG